MKTKTKMYQTIGLVLISALLISCAKPTSPKTTPPASPPTNLEINVHDASGIYSVPTPNPKVQLFKSETDRANKTNPASALKTGDASGNVTFDSLEAINYYFNAYNSSMTLSNATTSNNTTTLTAGILNKRTAVVK